MRVERVYFCVVLILFGLVSPARSTEPDKEAAKPAKKPSVRIKRELFLIDGKMPETLSKIEASHQKLVSIDGEDAMRKEGYEIANDLVLTQTMLSLLSQYHGMEVVNAVVPKIGESEETATAQMDQVSKRIYQLKVAARNAQKRQENWEVKQFGRRQRRQFFPQPPVISVKQP